MLLETATTLLLFILQDALAGPTPTPRKTPTKTTTTKPYKTSKSKGGKIKGSTIKLDRKGAIILGSVIGGIFGICLLAIAFVVIKRTIQERREARTLKRKAKIENEQPSEEAQATASNYPGLFETPQSKSDDQLGKYTQVPTHDGAAPPYQAKEGSVGFESSLNATAAAVGNESWKQGTIVQSSPPGTEQKER
ncbi:hypothetical protein FS837_003025 [Tulasnella sp. UAMH 9824]|nr:hypothetical protein FS837_003025 [Tulasnella sp. UAMH 9824]